MAFIGKKGKAYGLINAKEEKKLGLLATSKTKKPAVQAKPSIFDESDEDEHAFDERFATFDVKKAALTSSSKTAPKVDIGKCLAEDPSIFEYDSIYDSISAEKEDRTGVKCVRDRKPKYIAGLLKSAAERNIEIEYQKERKVQKEREAEGSQFADKEAFVTSAYKKKMEEFKILEQKSKLQDLVDSKHDVTKKEDMTSFYKHILSLETTKQSDTAITDGPDTTEKSSSSQNSNKSEKSLPSNSQSHKRQRSRSKERSSRSHRHRSRSGSRSSKSKFHSQRHRSRSRSQDKGKNGRDKHTKYVDKRRQKSGSDSSDDTRVAKKTEENEEPLDLTDQAVVDPHLLVKYRMKNTENSINDARARYLARKNQVAPVIADDEDE